VIICAYGALKGKEMVNKEGWNLTSQFVLSKPDELEYQIRLKDNENFEVAI
jgi:hypothetical protein